MNYKNDFKNEIKRFAWSYSSFECVINLKILEFFRRDQMKVVLNSCELFLCSSNNVADVLCLVMQTVRSIFYMDPDACG